tara:strand:+ start:154 stop:519 length:366 start_codon:yes stop_codon:yes gene_type:complete
MNDINETMDNAIRENDTNKIDDIVFNPKNVLIRVYEYNFDYNSGRYVDKWISIKDVNQEEFDWLSDDEQSYVQQMPKYSHLDYDGVVKQYDQDVLPIVIKRERSKGWEVDNQGNIIGIIKK